MTFHKIIITQNADTYPTYMHKYGCLITSFHILIKPTAWIQRTYVVANLALQAWNSSKIRAKNQFGEFHENASIEIW